MGRELFESPIASKVVEYLRQHPQAMDTATGIAEWWIPEVGKQVDKLEMERALDELVQKGLVERVGAGVRAHYRLKRD